MSQQAPFPRLTRLLQALGWLPQPQHQVTTTKPRPSRTQKPGLERYDFAESGQLPELVEEIKRGELPTPKIEPFEPDFSSYSPSETAKRLKEKMGLKTYKGPIPEPIVHRLASSPLQESLVANVDRWPVYERDTSPAAAWGSAGPTYSMSLGNRPTANPEELSPPIIGKRSSYTENPVIRESFEEMMKGTLPKPTPQPTIKDEWQTVERNQEPYVFWE